MVTDIATMKILCQQVLHIHSRLMACNLVINIFEIMIKVIDISNDRTTLNERIRLNHCY